MGHQKRAILLVGTIAAIAAYFFSSSAFAAEAAIDAEAAKALAKKDHCLRCHGIDKKKEGPTYHAIAYKYKDQADAQDKLIKHITSGEDRVKLSDGHMEDHKVDKSSSPEQVRNLIGWILAQ